MSVHRVRRKNKLVTTRTLKGIEVLVRETARKVCSSPENVVDPMIAPQDYDVRQSGRVLELQNRDLWIRLILVTIRAMLFKKSSEQSSSWSWQQPMIWASSSSSAWGEWSSDQTRERSDWQSADWNSSDQARKATAWQSHSSWQ